MTSASRTCPSTGLRVYATADALIKAHAVVATVALLVGGVAALLVLLTRWQAVHLLDAVWFYRVLTVHGMSMLIFFIIFFEMAVLYFAGPVVLNSRVPAPLLGWAIQAFGVRPALYGLAAVVLAACAMASVLFRSARIRMFDAAAGAVANARLDRAFYLLAAVFFLAAAAGLMVLSQAAAIVQSYGGATTFAIVATTFITGAVGAARIRLRRMQPGQRSCSRQFGMSTPSGPRDGK